VKENASWLPNQWVVSPNMEQRGRGGERERECRKQKKNFHLKKHQLIFLNYVCICCFDEMYVDIKIENILWSVIDLG
jgi:hypothetical protein